MAIRSIKALHRILRRPVRSGEIAGHAAAISWGAHSPLYFAEGYQDRQSTRPIDQSTMYRLYSMTKPVTSVAAMQLIETQRLALDDAVQDFLPCFKNQLVFVEGGRSRRPKRPITIRDLLRHTSGLVYGYGTHPVDQLYRDAGLPVQANSLEDLVEKVSDIPLCSDPGERFCYSLSTDVLARVIEVVSGLSFSDYLQTRLFDPLRMHDTHFQLPAPKVSRLMDVTRVDSTDEVDPDFAVKEIDGVTIRFPVEANFASGCQGLISTIDDYLRFCRMLLGKGTLDGVEALRAESVDEMLRSQMNDVLARPDDMDFGLGFRLSDRGDVCWGGVSGTRFWIHPELDLAIVYMCQTLPYGTLSYAKNFRDATYRLVRQIDKNPNASTVQPNDRVELP